MNLVRIVADYIFQIGVPERTITSVLEDAVVHEDELLTASDVARLSEGEISPATVRSWDALGKLRAMRTMGGVRLWFRSDVERALANRRRTKDAALAG